VAVPTPATTAAWADDDLLCLARQRQSRPSIGSPVSEPARMHIHNNASPYVQAQSNGWMVSHPDE
jgi:hypothetical protein